MSDRALSPDTNAEPVFPRRAVVAAMLSAIAAGGVTWLGVVGSATVPEMQSFQFSRGASFASGEQDRLRGHLSAAIADDRIVVTIVGHSGIVGDAQANRSLSESRAGAASDIALAMGIDSSRLTVVGIGGAAPLAKQEGETDRAYQSRLARVDVALQLRR